MTRYNRRQVWTMSQSPCEVYIFQSGMFAFVRRISPIETVLRLYTWRLKYSALYRVRLPR